MRPSIGFAGSVCANEPGTAPGDCCGSLRFRGRPIAWLLIAAGLGMPLAVAAETDVASMSLEELLSVELTTVSRKAQRLTDTAAAAFVISAEDIARSGATSIPELLRMVPGMHVQRLSSSRWAVGARGFAGRFANKLLVLMDGRSVYSPLFGGVFWEHDDTMLEDIERIEVIRGPGAAIWGANAVNGVINIITKRARETQGGLVVAHAGDEERAGVALRYGGTVADDGHFRVWGKGFRRDASRETDDGEKRDVWTAYRAGFRWDQRMTDGARLSLIGTAANGRSEDEWLPPSLQQPFVTERPVTQHTRGANLLGRYERTLEGGSLVNLQVSAEYMDTEISGTLTDQRTTFDIDAQHQFQWGRHEVIWGLGYRRWSDEIDTTDFVSITPQRRSEHLASAFAHNEFNLVPDHLKFILGAKAEHNSITGFELQPNARLLWTPSPGHTMWSAVSRAIRLPSRGERDSSVNLLASPQLVDLGFGPIVVPLLVRNVANADLDSEKLTAFEVGYRAQLLPRLSVDAAVFYNRYSSLRAGSTAVGGAQFDPATGALVLATIPANNLDASTRGLELAMDWHPLARWRLQGAYTYFRMDGKRTGDRMLDETADLMEGTVPRSQWSLRSSVNLGRNRQLDVWLRRVGSLPAVGVAAYTAVDLRYAWQATKDLELSVVGQNLFDPRHVEGVVDFLPAQTMEIERGAFIKAKWRF